MAKTPRLPLQGAWIQSLVRELDATYPYTLWPKTKTNNKKRSTLDDSDLLNYSNAVGTQLKTKISVALRRSELDLGFHHLP